MKRILILALGLGFFLGLAVFQAFAEKKEEWAVKGRAVTGTEIIKEDQRSSKFFEYRDLPSGFFVDGFNLSLAKGDRYIDFAAARVGRKDGTYNFSLGSYGKYKFSLGYNRIPHAFSFDGRTLFYESGPGVYILSDSIQKAAQAAAGDAPYSSRTELDAAMRNARLVVSDYLVGATPVALALQRNKTTLAFNYEISSPLSFSLNAVREIRNGTRPIGASLGFSNLIELPEPIDSVTTNIDGRLEFAPAWGAFQAGYSSSIFDNNIPTLRWDNPFRISDQTYDIPSGAYQNGNGSALGQLSLAPSNRAQRFYFNGLVRVLKSIRLQGAVSYGFFSQNEALLPFTVNSALNEVYPAATSGPGGSANAKAAVSTIDFTLSARLVKNVNLNAGYRQYNFKNESRERNIDGFSVVDQTWEATPETMEPYSFNNAKLFGSLSFHFLKNTSLQLGYTRSSFKRKLGEEDEGKNDEGTFKASLDSSPVGWLWLRASFLSAKREWSLEGRKDIYIPGFAFRRYEEANRARRAVNFQAGLSPFNNFDLTFSLSEGKDNYPKSEYGLKKSEFQMYAVEASYAIGNRASVYGFYSREEYSGDQASRKSGATFSTNTADDWTAALKDTFQTLEGGFTADLIKDKLDFDISYSTSQAKGTADLYSPPGGDPDVAVNFDKSIDSTTIRLLKTKLLWKLGPAFAVAAGYWYESYTIEDITRTLLTVDKLLDSASLYLGALEPDYKYQVGYLKFIFNW